MQSVHDHYSKMVNMRGRNNPKEILLYPGSHQTPDNFASFRPSEGTLSLTSRARESQVPSDDFLFSDSAVVRGTWYKRILDRRAQSIHVHPMRAQTTVTSSGKRVCNVVSIKKSKRRIKTGRWTPNRPQFLIISKRHTLILCRSLSQFGWQSH